MLWIWIKRLIGTVALLAMVAAFGWALREKPVPVDAGTVTRGPLEVTISQEGQTRVREVYSVSSPIAGHLARTLLEEGDRVTADTTVVASIHPLDPPLVDSRSRAELLAAREAAQASIQMAESEYQRIQSQLQFAKDNLERSRQLHESRVLPDTSLQEAISEVDTLTAALQTGRASIVLRSAELARVEAQLGVSKTALSDHTASCCVNLTAPINGVVLTVFAKSEQPVAVGTKIAEIGDPSDLEVVVDLLSSDAVKITPGTAARITDWGGDRILSAVVRRIEPAGFTKVSALGIEEQRVNLVLDLKEKDARLGHGFRVYVELALWQGKDSVRVPISALFRTGRLWSVFIIEDGRAHKVEVQIGHMNDEMAEVESGLEEGQFVVLHPSATITDGSLVEAREE